MKSKKGETGFQLLKQIAIGSAGAVIATLAGALVCACLLQREMMGEEQIALGAMGVLLVSALFGSLLGCSMGKEKHLLCAVGIGVVYWLILLAIHGAVYPTGFVNVSVTLLLVLGVSLAGGLLRVYRMERSGSRKRKRRNR